MDRVADRIVVQRSDPLAGEVVVPGAKNSVLKLMVASLYATGRHELTNVPDISDVETMGALLGALGVRVNRDPDDDPASRQRRQCAHGRPTRFGHQHSRVDQSSRTTARRRRHGATRHAGWRRLR
jgi:UDP-N-acetylglucosamine enolpyruvyl transferase